MSITEVVATAVESYITPECPIWKLTYIETNLNHEPEMTPTLHTCKFVKLFQQKECSEDMYRVSWDGRDIPILNNQVAEELTKQIRENGSNNVYFEYHNCRTHYSVIYAKRVA